jgi:hypothetical protein
MLAMRPGGVSLIELEDAAPDILFERLPGSPVPLWPSVRYPIAMALEALDVELVPVAPGMSSGSPWLRLARAILPSRGDIRMWRGRRRLTFLLGGGSVYPTAEGMRNTLVGDYVEDRAHDSAIVQWRPVAAKHAFSPTLGLDPLVVRASARARFSPLPPGTEDALRRIVTELVRVVDSRLTMDHVAPIVEVAAHMQRLRPWVDRGFDRVLDRLEPHVVVMEDASYGSWPTLISGMKARGIRVVEPQHGWIGPSHAAYNYGGAMSRPELAVTMPDELLTYGEYWSEGVRFPGTVTAIGKPHLEAQSASAPPAEVRAHEVLVVSSTTAPDAMSDLVVALHDALPANWSVRFRPHPAERATLQAIYPRLISRPGLTIDDNADVARSLAGARVVIGVASTVLYEAVAMGCRVYAIDSPLAQYYVGDLFGELIAGAPDAPRIAAEIASTDGIGDRGDASPDPAALWKPDAVGNFRRWAVERLG